MNALLAALAIWIVGIPLLVIGLAMLSIPLRRRTAAQVRGAEVAAIPVTFGRAAALRCGVRHRHASSGRTTARRFTRPVVR